MKNPWSRFQHGGFRRVSERGNVCAEAICGVEAIVRGRTNGKRGCPGWRVVTVMPIRVADDIRPVSCATSTGLCFPLR